MSEWIDNIIKTVEQWVKDGIWSNKQAGQFYLDLAKALPTKPRENRR